MPHPDLKHVLANYRKTGMLAYLQSHLEDFDELVALALSQEQPYAWRAAWLLSDCMDDNDVRLQPHVERFIDLLPMKSDGQKRELLKVLSRMEIPDENEGKLFDCCLSIWENTKMAAGVKYYAFKMLLKIAGNHAELQNEIKFLTEPHYLESLSQGIRHSVLLMINKI